MSIKVNLSQNRAPISQRFCSTSLKSAANSLIVNQRHLGAKGELSQGFGTNTKQDRRGKMQLKSMMRKVKNADYQGNPIAQRRLQQKIAMRAGEIYGVNSSKLIKPLSATERSANYGGNTLKTKVNGKT